MISIILARIIPPIKNDTKLKLIPDRKVKINHAILAAFLPCCHVLFDAI